MRKKQEVKPKATDYRFKILYCIGMIMIVAGHCDGGGINLLSDWFPYYGFHLGLFLFASGYFYKTKYENQPTSERLTRIETSVFGTSFPNDSDSERIERLSSAIQAQKSARRYDSNRFNQNMATAFQIGTLILMVLACIL